MGLVLPPGGNTSPKGAVSKRGVRNFTTSAPVSAAPVPASWKKHLPLIVGGVIALALAGSPGGAPFAAMILLAAIVYQLVH